MDNKAKVSSYVFPAVLAGDSKAVPGQSVVGMMQWTDVSFSSLSPSVSRGCQSTVIEFMKTNEVSNPDDYTWFCLWSLYSLFVTLDDMTVTLSLKFYLKKLMRSHKIIFET